MNIFILISLLRKLSSPSLTCHLSCLTSWPACPWGWFGNDSFSMSSSTWLDWLWIYQVTVTNGKTLLHFGDKQTNNIHFCSNISILKRALKLIFVFSLQKNVFAKFCWTYLAQLLWRIWNCEKFDNQKRSLELKQRKIYPYMHFILNDNSKGRGYTRTYHLPNSVKTFPMKAKCLFKQYFILHRPLIRKWSEIW